MKKICETSTREHPQPPQPLQFLNSPRLECDSVLLSPLFPSVHHWKSICPRALSLFGASLRLCFSHSLAPRWLLRKILRPPLRGPQKSACRFSSRIPIRNSAPLRRCGPSCRIAAV